MLKERIGHVERRPWCFDAGGRFDPKLRGGSFIGQLVGKKGKGVNEKRMGSYRKLLIWVRKGKRDPRFEWRVRDRGNLRLKGKLLKVYITNSKIDRKITSVGDAEAQGK